MAHEINPPKIQANTDDGITSALHAGYTRVFRERWAQSTEQSLRLVSERLQRSLRDKDAQNNQEVYYLARVLEILYDIDRDNRAG